jgi:hypothetical protein
MDNVSRPIARLAEELEQRLQQPFTYEDGRWVDNELGDITNEPQMRVNNPIAPAGHVRIPARGSIIFRPPDGPLDQQKVSVKQALDSFLNIHEAGKKTSYTTLPPNEGFIHIVPGLMNQEASGSSRSPLSASVSISVSDVSAYTALEELCAAVTSGSGVKVAVAMVPANYLNQRRISLSINKATARDVLMTILHQSHWTRPQMAIPPQTLSWQLFYNHDMDTYFLNIHGVTTPRITTPRALRAIAH